MRSGTSLSRWLTASAIVAACGAAVAASATDGPDTPARPVTVKVIDADGVERVVDPSQVGVDFAAIARAAAGGGGGEKSNGKSWKDVSEGYEQVRSTTDGQSFYGLWVNKKTNQILAELPRGFENQRHFFAMTVSGGEIFAGLQAGDLYVYWKRIGEDRLALVSPQIDIRSNGDQGSKDSVERIFTDRVILDVPIVTTGPGGQPVIDLDQVLVGQASKFFGGSARGLQGQLAELGKAKAFPENVEVAYTVPDATGLMKTFHYSISHIKGTPGYQPREADSRVGYFITSFRDLGQVDSDEVATRYINRWHLEKADKSLKLSPPKEPVVYYVEHTVPVKYRRWVKAGVDYWNEAYRAIGIDGAIQVRYQDKQTGQYMDIDPEDVRYNFIRWLNNDISTAIGPSRVNPMTGEILDADVVLTDGWLRVFTSRWENLIPDMAMEGFDAETLEWLEGRPQWDPRVRLASPASREEVLRERQAQRGVQRFGGVAAGRAQTDLLGDDELDGLIGRTSQVNGMCMAATGKAMHLAMARMHLSAIAEIAPWILADADDFDPDEIPPELLEQLKKSVQENPEMLGFLPPEMQAKLKALLEADAKGAGAEAKDAEAEEPAEEGDKAKEKKGKKKAGDPSWMGDSLDGMPEEFVGPMLAELVAHEVGHTLGLRHNFKGSSAYTLAEINSEEFKGKTSWSTSVMDYNGINIRMPLADGASGDTQGDFSSINIGPYDFWVIEYGYGFGDLNKVLARSAEPVLAYGTDEDTQGPDPYARRYDLSKDPIDWCRNQMELVRFLRARIISDFVDDGDTWGKARQGYQIALGQHIGAVSTMANWVGGAFVSRAKKGDPGSGEPITPVPASEQREALRFVIDNTFYDEAFGLSPELLRHMSIEKWYDTSVGGSVMDDNNLPVHDQVLGVQASAMTMLLNPTTLRRVHDNQYFFEDKADAFTLGEVMRTVTDSAWGEVLGEPNGGRRGGATEISSLRQNLQREHVERLVDLMMPGNVRGAAAKPIAALASMHLRDLKDAVQKRVEAGDRSMDDMTRAHLTEVHARIVKALDAQYIYNTDDISAGGGGPITVILGQDGASGR